MFGLKGFIADPFDEQDDSEELAGRMEDMFVEVSRAVGLWTIRRVKKEITHLQYVQEVKLTRSSRGLYRIEVIFEQAHTDTEKFPSVVKIERIFAQLLREHRGCVAA